MKSVTKTVIFPVAMLLALGVSASARAAPNTWVSGTGNDGAGNPCSRALPCATFINAYSRTDAGGQINVLDPGDFGNLTITKALTINGSGGSIALVNQILVVAAGTTDTVILRNLDINGFGVSGEGIIFQSGGTLIVENSTIQQ